MIDLIAAFGGLLVPPIFDFVKKKFLKQETDTPEATMSSLATTKPDILPEYVKSITSYLEAKVKAFNEDVIGIPSQWVVNVRAIIRPAGVVISALGLIVDGLKWVTLDPSTRYTFEVVVSSWFGSRLFPHK